MKGGVRRIRGRGGGRRLGAVVAELRSYLVGWKLYYHLAATPGIFADVDKWLHRRLRALHLKQWKRGTTTYRELRRPGVWRLGAREVAAHARRCCAMAKDAARTGALPTTSVGLFRVLGLAPD